MKEPKDYYLNENYNCSEAILRTANQYFDLKLDQNALNLASGYGGGMGAGYACGALCSCLAVIGVLFSNGKAHETDGFKELCGMYVNQFEQKFGHKECLEIKKDFFKDDGTRCLTTVSETWNLLKLFISDHQKS